MECPLCDALEKERDRVIYTDDYVFVLVNNEPIKDGHVMILPKRHAEQLKDLSREESESFLKAIDVSMSAVTNVYGETPMCLINGWKFRTQPHLHAHVLPSKKNLRGLYAASEGLEERKRADEQTLQSIADKMKPFFAEGYAKPS
jgi:histidine triad (HIT) family protein